MFEEDIYCHHCREEVASRTYKKHRANYYNELTKQWRTADTYSISSSESEDSETETADKGTLAYIIALVYIIIKMATHRSTYMSYIIHICTSKRM